jgi:hypothetical protein
MSRHPFYYHNIKKQQALNGFLSLDPRMIWGICQQVKGTQSVENDGV